MPHLMVNLEDPADCRRGIEILQRRMNRMGGPGVGPRHRPPCEDESEGRSERGFKQEYGPERPPRRGRGPGQENGPEHGPEHRRGRGVMGPGGDVADLPLPQKLKRIQSRGMWKHLLKIAQLADQPRSLPELDEQLELPKNKMRSLKAIMAKLENRFDLQFLKVDAEAGEDPAGNPRYIMPPRVRRQILRLAE
jgi:hypothetical protein